MGKQTWLRCSQELPSKEGLYLVYAPSADKNKPFIHVAWYDNKIHSWELVPAVWSRAITHWMFIPNPPKE